MSIYMYIPGIAGPVTAKNYERWICYEEYDLDRFGSRRKMTTADH